MSIDKSNIAKKLKHARNNIAISLSELAHQVGINQSRLSDFENGSTEPTGDEILILASFYKCDYMYFISDTISDPFVESDILFRKGKNELSKSDKRIVRDFTFLCESQAFLEESLNVSNNTFNYKPKENQKIITHGIEGAMQLRTFLGRKEDTIPKNIYEDIRKIGVKVFRMKLQDSDISGFYINHHSAGNCILINYSEDVYRQKFSAAHELAHAIFDRDQEALMSYNFTSSRYDRSDLLEKRANWFAGEYLLPEVLMNKVTTGRKITIEVAKALAESLQVSIPFFLTRASYLKILSYKDYRSLMVESKTEKINKSDPELVDNFTEKQLAMKKILLEKGLSDYYIDLCFRAYHENLISKGKLAEICLSNIADLEGIAKLYGRSLNHVY